ncbi:MAG TPA: phosphatidylinositol kinase [Arcobacter sp.]|nr:phosphatidylinositol kinase [Arcobacter sp.]
MKGYVYDEETFVGEISLENGHYIFQYDSTFLENSQNFAISLTLPKRQEPYISENLHPFFSNILAEGNLKKLQCKQLKIDEEDEFTRLLKTAHSDTIGAITVREER